jgi:hypothetical protein
LQETPLELEACFCPELKEEKNEESFCQIFAKASTKFRTELEMKRCRKNNGFYSTIEKIRRRFVKICLKFCSKFNPKLLLL